MQTLHFSALSSFGWERTLKKKMEGLNDYTPRYDLRGHHHKGENIFCIDRRLANLLSISKIPKDSFGDPVLLDGLWAGNQKFFLKLRGRADVGDYRYFLAEADFQEWMEAMDWFYYKIFDLKKERIKKEIWEQTKQAIDILFDRLQA